MDKSDKVIRVDFTGKRRSAPLALGLSRRLTVAVFASALAGLVIFVALFWPEWIFSAFFAPTVILIGVLVALGVKKVTIRIQIWRLHRAMVASRPAEEEEPKGRTLH